jgi:large subunit ribosomal protein L31
MKEDTHPDNFRPVIFHDTTSGEQFLFKSTVETSETGEHEGEEYPLTRIEMSSTSHPFYTGVEKVVDTAGRVEKFEARSKKAQKKQEEEVESDNESDQQEDTDFDSGDSQEADTDENTDN